jgi:catechol 2,3-dioxygenase-like lactoylglutathione lyase family enzyme
MTKIADIAYVTYQHPDLDLCERFLTDFGLITVVKTDTALYMRGRGKKQFVYIVEWGKEAKFVSFALEATSESVLHELATLASASTVETLFTPGGGQRIKIIDPNGFNLELVYGIEEVEPLPIPEPLQWNHASQKTRLGRTQRPKKEPAPILGLGHLAIDVKDFEESYHWYCKVLVAICWEVKCLTIGKILSVASLNILPMETFSSKPPSQNCTRGG